MCRYGQDEIEQMLLAAGAKEHVEPPKKISVVGTYSRVWYRLSSRDGTYLVPCLELSYCRRQQNQRNMCEDLLGYSHKQAKQ